MKAETADYLAKARATLADAQKIAALPLPHVAAREAYLARSMPPRLTSSSKAARWRRRTEASVANLPGWRGPSRVSDATS
jgi:hypothetical protein